MLFDLNLAMETKDAQRELRNLIYSFTHQRHKRLTRVWPRLSLGPAFCSLRPHVASAVDSPDVSVSEGSGLCMPL